MAVPTEIEILDALSGPARDKGRTDLAQVVGCGIEQLAAPLERLKLEGAVKERGPSGYGDPRTWNTFLSLTVVGWQRLRDAQRGSS